MAFRRPFLSILLASASLIAPVIGIAVSNKHCKVLPGDRDWPSQKKWAEFNSTINGRLIAGVPLASPCHNPNYDAATCEELQDIWNVPQTYFGHPVEIISAVFQNDTCDPFSGPTTPCLQGNLAVYAVNVSGAADVISSLRFATKHKLRLSIKNTGHDYLGRSSGQGSLGLWTHNLKNLTFFNYSSANYTGPAATLGAGIQAFEAYAEAAAHGVHLVGGDCPTVGLAGGYAQGGGHGPLGGEYGLGADQVLEWEVVTPQGEHLVATPTQNQDLYWALSGGGGGTFGVVLSMTVKAYADGPVGGAQLNFNSTGLNDTFWELIGIWQERASTLAEARISAAGVFNLDQFAVQIMTKVNATAEEMAGYLKPFTDELDSRAVPYNLTTTSFPTYLEHVNHYLGPLPYGIYTSNQYLGGRLVPRSVVENNNQGLLDVYRQIAAAGYEFNFHVQNVSHAQVGVDESANAVLPAWRDSLINVVVDTYWNYSEPDAVNVAGVNSLTEDIMPLLYDVTPDSGSYLNEADWQDPNWQVDFFGSNYGRLKSIKDRYDPDGLLYAHPGVGSEEWEVTSEGRLCRVV